MSHTFESGYCTWKKGCVALLRNGEGQQVQNQDGSLERYCPRHYHEWCHDLEVAAEELRRQQGEKGPEALAFGAALALLLILFLAQGVIR